MRITSLAVITRSFAGLDVKNQVLLNIVKEVINIEIASESSRMHPMDALYFLSAFIKNEMMEKDLLERLEGFILSQEQELTGNELGKLFIIHADWSRYMYDQCCVRHKIPMIKFHDYWRYNDQFYEKCALILSERVHEVNVRTALFILYNGYNTHFKRHANLRKMYVFMIRGVKLIEREKELLGDNLLMTCSLYYNIGLKYCHANSDI